MIYARDMGTVRPSKERKMRLQCLQVNKEMEKTKIVNMKKFTRSALELQM